MEQWAAVLMLGSGAAHAVVNAILKSGGDKMSSRALIDGSSALLLLPLAFIVPWPVAASPWLAASFAVHLVYLICLIKAFEDADMSAVYPVMRGSAPVLAATAAVLWLRDPVTLPVIGGMALVTLGTVTVAWWNPPSRRALAWALGTGATIAAYTVIDAKGVRGGAICAELYCLDIYFNWLRDWRPVCHVARIALYGRGAQPVETGLGRGGLVDRYLWFGAMGLPIGRRAAAGGIARKLDPVRRGDCLAGAQRTD